MASGDGFALLSRDSSALVDSVNQEILEVVKAYDAVLLARDQAFREDLYDAYGQLPDGSHMKKQAYIAESGRSNVTESTASNQMIRPLSDTAAVESGTFFAIGRRDAICPRFDRFDRPHQEIFAGADREHKCA